MTDKASREAPERLSLKYFPAIGNWAGSKISVEGAVEYIRSDLAGAVPEGIWPTEVVDGIIRDIAELPDRTSPDEHPDWLMVTEDELKIILLRSLKEFRDRNGKYLADIRKLERELHSAIDELTISRSDRT